jgi:hypothetical protein
MGVDRFGHCVKCGKNMAIKKVINGKETIVFTPDYDNADFNLSDGSLMRVTICREDKDKLTVENQPEIMQNVYNGWVEELNQSKWTEEKKKDYLDKYSKLSITTRAR